MNHLEIQKTRLDIIMKLFYPFITIFAGLFYYFSDASEKNWDHGHIFLLAIESSLAVLLITMVRYVFFELNSLKKGLEEEIIKTERINADNAYEKVFVCFKSGIISFFILTLFHTCAMKFPNIVIFLKSFMNYILYIPFSIALLLNLVPPLDLTINVRIIKSIKNESEESKDVVFEDNTPMNKIKNLQWFMWILFVFCLLYNIWF